MHGARWSRATSPSSIPAHDLAASGGAAALHDALTFCAEPHRNTFIKPFHREQTAGSARAATRCVSTCGERLPLVPRVQRLRQLAGIRRLGTGRAVVLLSAKAAAVCGLPHAARQLERSGRQKRQVRRTATARIRHSVCES
jgi:hypothetical protein